MIEWINNTFGVGNEVSVPTLISLIVFITGGIINYMFIKLKEYNLRTINRETFVDLLKQTIKDLKVKERNMNKFFPQVVVSREENWKYLHQDISYLETLLQFDFTDTYYSFRRKFFYSFERKIKIKAFHKIWSKLVRIKFFEDKVLGYVDELSKSFAEHQRVYNLNLEKYREFKESQGHDINQGKIDISEKTVIQFLQVEDDIISDWLALGEERFNIYRSYNQFVKPILMIHRKYSDLEITLGSAQLLINCELEYHNLEISLQSYHTVFKNFYLGYKRDHKLLSKYMERI